MHHIVGEDGRLLTGIDLLAERGPFRGQHVAPKAVAAVADISDPERGKARSNARHIRVDGIVRPGQRDVEPLDPQCLEIRSWRGANCIFGQFRRVTRRAQKQRHTNR